VVADLRSDLGESKHRLIYETYHHDNWELYVVNADGSNKSNLTETLNRHELYPQVSPDGKRVAFVSDEGAGRQTKRSVYVMDIDGGNRNKVADYARQPFWHPNSELLGFLPQEFKKFNVVDYGTKGMSFYHVETGKITEHPNKNLFHLYNPSYAPNGKWIASTVHAGMGFDHAILLIEAEGQKVINLNIPGCRPCLGGPEGKHISWGKNDYTMVIAPIDLDAADPKVGKPILEITDGAKAKKNYHVDWSSDGKFLSVSRGPKSKGDPNKPGTHQAACEMVGIYASDWDIFAVQLHEGTVDLNSEKDQARYVNVTADGKSNKESSWVPTMP